MGKIFSGVAVPKCQDRLSKAKRALYECRNATAFERFQSRWSEFLIHSGSVLNALEAGSNHTAQGRQWYGKIKRACRQDELVRYLHQARNAEEHDIEGTSNLKPGGISLKLPQGSSIHIHQLVLDESFYRDPEAAIRQGVTVTKGSLLIEKRGGKAVLRPVTYRGVTFEPPSTHKGAQLAADDPITIGGLYIEFLEDLVRKATHLA